MLFITMTISQGCNHTSQSELKTSLLAIDTVLNSLKHSSETLNAFDDEAIEERADSMAIKEYYIKRNYLKVYRQNVTEELNIRMTRFSAIRKLYRESDLRFKSLTYDQEKYETHLNEVRSNLSSGSLSIDSFKNGWRKDRQTVAEHQKVVSEFARKISAAGEDYNRVNPPITTLFHELVMKVGEKPEVPNEEDEEDENK